MSLVPATSTSTTPASDDDHDLTTETPENVSKSRLSQSVRTALFWSLVLGSTFWSILLLGATVQFNAQRRSLLVIFAYLPFWVSAALALATFDEYTPIYSTFGGADTKWIRLWGNVAFLTSVFLLVVAMLPQIFLAQETNGGIGLYATKAACNASSCSSDATTSSVDYNAKGFFGQFGPSYADQHATVCVYQGCSWAGQADPPYTGVVIGFPPLFPPDDNLPDLNAPPCAIGQTCPATNLPSAYPDGSVGLANGLRLGTNASNTNLALCPGARFEGGVVKGVKVCSYCTQYWRDNLGYVEPGTEGCTFNSSVYSTDNAYFWCEGLCPPPNERRTPDDMWDEMWVVYTLVVFPVACYMSTVYSMNIIAERPIDAALNEEEFIEWMAARRDRERLAYADTLRQSS